MIRSNSPLARFAGASLNACRTVRPLTLVVMSGIILSTACASRVGAPATAGAAAPVAIDTESRPEITLSDNRLPAGHIEDGVLTVRLDARTGIWHPEGKDGLGLPVAAFAEEGKPMQNPGPLIRVTAGKEVRVIARNSLAKPLTLFGLGERRDLAADSVTIEPGEVREVRFRASEPGTFFYAGKTSRGSVFGRGEEDSQLNGAIVVDAPRSSLTPTDRVFVISWWFTLDSTSSTGLGRGTLAINGRAWPHTERLDVTQGDSLAWRWINLTGLDHPMHLHGFHFRVDGVGDGRHFTTYAPGERRLAVTEVVSPGGTMAMAWSPNRPGNWILHCHIISHMSHVVSLGTYKGVPAQPAGHAHDGSGPGPEEHKEHQMAGLVLGIRVAAIDEAPPPARSYRPIRLIIRSKPNVYGDRPGYSYVLGGSPAESDTSALPMRSPTLELVKDEPVAITIVNRSQEPAAVHWHGIELESFPDGVPGWSGEGKAVLPSIAPRDSMTVRFTPPRTGTFMYHSHFNELQQIASGLYGPIVVREPGERRDPDVDRVLLFSDGGPTTNIIRGPFAPALLNGSASPKSIELKAGTTYRFRLINIRTDFLVSLALVNGAEPVEWRVVAKDGADLPASQATTRPAQLTFAPGEIHDVEFTPRAPGTLTLKFGPPSQRRLQQQTIEVPVRVR